MEYTSDYGAIEKLEDLSIILNQDDEQTNKDIIDYYIALRLKPLINKSGIKSKRINKIAKLIADNYHNNAISIDLIINSVYNYYNATKNCPTDKLLSDDIETLLEDYSGVDELWTL